MSVSEQKIFWLPKYEDIPVLEHSVMLKTALEVCALLREQLNEAAERLEIQEQLLQKQAEQIALQAEEIQRLKDEIAREYMEQQKLPARQLELLSSDKTLPDKLSFSDYLAKLGIETEHHTRIVTEGALLASVTASGASCELVILSDDAGQFNVLGLLHALYWVHAGRTISKIIAYSEPNRAVQEQVREQIWNFYQELKQYKLSPLPELKAALDENFDVKRTT